MTTIGGGITTAALASTALADIDAKLDTITTSRASYGAAMSRFSMRHPEPADRRARTSRPRAAASWTPTSRPRPSNMSRAQILQQAGTAMVAQANQLPQQVLQLLQQLTRRARADPGPAAGRCTRAGVRRLVAA